MPRGSMAQFFSDKGGPEHGGPLQWPGTPDGFPVRGPVQNVREEDAADVPLALEYRSRSFRLWDAGEHAAFDAVMQRIVNGWYMQHKRVDRWCDEHTGLLVWMEWVQIYGEVATDGHPGVTNDGSAIQQQAGSGPFGVAAAGKDRR